MRDGNAIAEELNGRRVRRGWEFPCPCHRTNHNSAILFDSGVLYCHAKCDPRAIAAALDKLDFPDDGKTVEVDYEKIAADEAARITEARWMWYAAMSEPDEHNIPPVAAYLKSRGIELPVPPVLRGKYRSKFLAAITQLDGTITAVHDKYPRGRPKKGYTTGVVKGGAVQLAPPRDGHLGLAEGVENALSATQMFSIPCWAAIGTRLDAVELPGDVTRVHLFPDNDGAPGRKAAERALVHYLQTVAVEIWWPDEGCDWNNMLLRGKK